MLTANENLLELEITSSSASDSGQYALIVSNVKAENKAAFSLNVF